jgi:hypothetical protein
MAGHMFLNMPGSLALGIVEMQMQLATADIPQVLGMPVNEWKNHVIGKLYLCEGCVLWQ